MIECQHDPIEHKGAPIGQYHCPECGMMVLAGMPHPKFVFYKETITKDDKELMGMTTKGWYAMGIAYDLYGPFETREKAEIFWANDCDRDI